MNGKKYLSWRGVLPYSPSVVPQRATGRETPCNTSATYDAPRVFFYVATNATERRFMAWCVSVQDVAHHIIASMVAQAGHPQGWPVSDVAGILTPVWAIAIERENSGDSNICYTVEIIAMMTTPTPSHPQFVWLFLAVRRSDVLDRPHREEVTAPDYNTARRVLARDYVTAFAGRLPVRGGIYE